ncbi:unnamed protein product [Ectocarpus sp. CCAP 1310/34]|nr:unnamed protein product [Ectocarpus sp. CCAP 1310/34]
MSGTEEDATLSARLDEALRAIDFAKAETKEAKAETEEPRAERRRSAGAPAGRSSGGDGLVAPGGASSAPVRPMWPGGVSHDGGTGVPGLPLGGTMSELLCLESRLIAPPTPFSVGGDAFWPTWTTITSSTQSSAVLRFPLSVVRMKDA